MKNDAYFIFTHGNRDGEIIGTMFDRPFYYGAFDSSELKTILSDVGFKIISFTENYKEQTTGTRDLLVIAQKSVSH